jgi:acetyltransferase
MDYFAGLDISMDETHAFVLDRKGEVVHESKTRSAAQAIADELAKAPSCRRIVFETGRVLVKLGQLAADVPKIRELDINPLLADQDRVIAIDARVAIAPLAGGHHGRGHPRFAVQPYPKEWERSISLPDRTVFVRPVRPDDEDMYRAFFVRATPEDLRLRFFAPVRDLSHRFIAGPTQIDYARAIALVAIDPSSGEMLGVVQLHADAEYG